MTGVPGWHAIREERPEDFPNIRAPVEAAFKTARGSAGDGHDYVDRLRAGDGYIPELALRRAKGLGWQAMVLAGDPAY